MRRPPFVLQTVVATGVLLLAASPARALPTLPGWLDPYIRAEAGAAFPLRSPQTDYFSTGFGGRLNIGTNFFEYIGVQLTGQPVALPAKDTSPSNEAGVPLGLGGGLRLKLPNHFVVIPWIDSDLLYVRTGTFDRIGFAAGAGLNIPVGPTRSWRIGPFVRFYDVLAPAATAEHKVSADALMFISGISIEAGLPRKKAFDRDEDGVADAEDRCPDKPGLAATFGCPDKDNDGIVDSLDRCVAEPGPPATFGCPDADRDGLVDGQDRCPSEAGPTALVGCPDRDGDFVVDRDDQCPSQAGPVRSAGCPDRDGDTVGDARDKCPDVVGDVSAEGCPDQDGDTVADTTDLCPEEKGALSARGCPDQDGDTIVDAEDKCPAESGSALAGGCPDKDGDAIADADDKCPEYAGDKEHDGCPGKHGEKLAIAGKAAPAAKAAPAGKAAPAAKADVDAGDPAAPADLKEKVYFAFNRADVENAYQAVLDEIAGQLKHHPGIRLRLEGHADDRGTAEYNKMLSRGRADAVKLWFVAHGVPAGRLQVRGYGSTRPLDAQPTDEARERNRRVEFIVIQRP